MERKAFLLTSILLLFSYSGLAQDQPLLKFVENKNQWDSSVDYAARIPGGRLFLSPTQFSVYLSDQKKLKEDDLHKHGLVNESDGNLNSDDDVINGHFLQIDFLNANLNSQPQGLNRSIEYYNYFLGKDSSKWASRAYAFSNLIYPSIYAGIDLKISSVRHDLKYDFVVKAEADASQIRIEYCGVDKMLLENGNILIETSLGNLIERKLYTYQLIEGEKREVKTEYSLSGNIFSFYFPEGYDPCYELIIDPVLVFSAYSGSTLDNWGNTATYDNHGNVYSGGMVNNPFDLQGFPVTVGAYQTETGGGEWDIGILKYDSSGSQLLYATYLGGSGTETPQSLVVNASGELLILGATGSSNFPGTSGSSFSGGTEIDPLHGVPYENGTDIFVAKLSEDGSQLRGAIYLGGDQNDGINFISGSMGSVIKEESPLARNYGDQLRGDIVSDESDTIYIASSTLSYNFPIVNNDPTNDFAGGSHDAVVVKLTPDLSSIVWSRLIGGSATDAAYSIKLDNEKIFVAGGTNSTNMPGMDGFKTSLQGDIDGWVLSLRRDDSSIINGTYLGTSLYDQTYFIDLNDMGEIYAFGQTKGNYPIQGDVYFNANGGQFIHKLSGDLSNSILSTRIGSGGNSPNISPTAFLVSECDNLYISGWGAY